jgi:hypothetical protein
MQGVSDLVAADMRLLNNDASLCSKYCTRAQQPDNPTQGRGRSAAIKIECEGMYRLSRALDPLRTQLKYRTGIDSCTS